MKEFFKDTFEYSCHFNEVVIKKILDSDLIEVPERAILLLNHTLNAHEVWNARIASAKCDTGIWELRPIDRLLVINQENYNNSVQIIEVFGLNETVSYTNSKGQPFQNTVQEVLFHVVNHSTYHRGQIAADLKRAGIEPPVTDYIFYKR